MVLLNMQISPQFSDNVWGDIRPIVRRIFLTQERQLIILINTGSYRCCPICYFNITYQCFLAKAACNIPEKYIF